MVKCIPDRWPSSQRRIRLSLGAYHMKGRNARGEIKTLEHSRCQPPCQSYLEDGGLARYFPRIDDVQVSIVQIVLFVTRFIRVLYSVP